MELIDKIINNINEFQQISEKYFNLLNNQQLLITELIEKNTINFDTMSSILKQNNLSFDEINNNTSKFENLFVDFMFHNNSYVYFNEKIKNYRFLKDDKSDKYIMLYHKKDDIKYFLEIDDNKLIIEYFMVYHIPKWSNPDDSRTEYSQSMFYRYGFLFDLSTNNLLKCEIKK